MKKRQFLAAILAAALLFSLLPSAHAEGGLILHWVQTGEQTANVTVEGINGAQGVFAAQLELALPGAYPNAQLTLPSGLQRTVYQAAPTVVVSGGSTSLTFYLYSDTAINEDGPFSLGSIDLGGPFAPPSAAKLTLLDWSMTPFGNADRTAVDISAEVAFLPFRDVSAKDWFYGAVQYVYSAGMMKGTAAHTFSPQSSTTRGMIVTIIHRLEGAPAAKNVGFTDVPAGQWYSDAVNWAASSGIVAGYIGGSFGPNDPITREQMAAILYRYAKYKGQSMTKQGSLSQFPDQSKVASYALEPLRWAIGTGLIKGLDTGELAPGNKTTRAQAATIFERFCKLDKK